jgi:hypothetical protein
MGGNFLNLMYKFVRGSEFDKDNYIGSLAQITANA